MRWLDDHGPEKDGNKRMEREREQGIERLAGVL